LTRAVTRECGVEWFFMVLVLLPRACKYPVALLWTLGVGHSTLEIGFGNWELGV